MAAPKPIAEVLSQLIARRGYARAGQRGAGIGLAQRGGAQFAAGTRALAVRRGTLEIAVANNLLAQELGFQTEELIRRLRKSLTEENITRLRFRVGPVAAQVK